MMEALTHEEGRIFCFRNINFGVRGYACMHQPRHRQRSWCSHQPDNRKLTLDEYPLRK